jgi:hypothetical protein
MIRVLVKVDHSERARCQTRDCFDDQFGIPSQRRPVIRA